VKQVTAKVISNIHILPECRRPDRRVSLESKLIWFNCPDIASKAIPGQFIMVRCGGECVLPRPFAIFRTYRSDLAIFYTVWEDGKGTEWLAGRRINDEVQIIGPLGNGFTINQTSKNLLLIAGGMGIAPIYFLAQEAISRMRSVTLLYGTESRDRYPIPPDIKHIQATEDGSIGNKGFVTDLIPQNIEKADQVFACGPLTMLSNMIKRKPELRIEGKQVQVSLEVRMGCGTGVCYGCTIKTKNGLKQVCKDGPVFNLDDIIWDSLSA
jgi:dihydroorotate dehydrogenase electron transfer subunit